jgi:HPt (histidine-containing phosphotransfer) domain-containing protein
MTYKTFNSDELMSNFEGDEDILKDLIKEFLSKKDEILAKIEIAIEEKNFSNLKLHAHTMKGVISNFYAESIRLLAYDLEKAGANSEDKNNKEIFLKLKNEMDIFIKELEQFEKTI